MTINEKNTKNKQRSTNYYSPQHRKLNTDPHKPHKKPKDDIDNTTAMH